MTRNDVSLEGESAHDRKALASFFASMEERATDPVHRRLLKAAANHDPATSLELELRKIAQEILDEA